MATSMTYYFSVFSLLFVRQFSCNKRAHPVTSFLIDVQTNSKFIQLKYNKKEKKLIQSLEKLKQIEFSPGVSVRKNHNRCPLDLSCYPTGALFSFLSRINMAANLTILIITLRKSVYCVLMKDSYLELLLNKDHNINILSMSLDHVREQLVQAVGPTCSATMSLTV